MIAFSYRREDSQSAVGRLADRLTSDFGKEAVFLDQDSIPLGVDFRNHVREVWHKSKVVLVVIGDRWFGARPGGQRRLDHSADHVRVEVELALTSNALVIPILLDQTPMPTVEELPESLAELPFRNALRLDTGRDFHHHADRLIRELKRLFAEPAREAPVTPLQTPGTTVPATDTSSGQGRSSTLQSLGTRLASIFTPPVLQEPTPAISQVDKRLEIQPPPVLAEAEAARVKPEEVAVPKVHSAPEGRFLAEDPTNTQNCGEDLNVPTFLRRRILVSAPVQAADSGVKLGRKVELLGNGELVISGSDLTEGKIRFRYKEGSFQQAEGSEWRAEIEEKGQVLRLFRNGQPEGFARVSRLDSVSFQRLQKRASSY